MTGDQPGKTCPDNGRLHIVVREVFIERNIIIDGIVKYKYTLLDKVVLPEPELPTIAYFFPGEKSRLIWCKISFSSS